MSILNFAPALDRATGLGEIARALGVSTPLFQSVVTESDPSKLYKLHSLAKRGRSNSPPIFKRIDALDDDVQLIGLPETREVWEPYAISLKLAHKSVASVLRRFLEARVPGFPHPAAYGFVKGRSTRSNAARHKGARHLMSADIKDFFNSISRGRVETALRASGIKGGPARDLARFLTINRTLPLGLNSSPLIANLILLELDRDFTRLAESSGFVYTRYADDLTFSSSGRLPSRKDVVAIIEKHGFTPNPKKWRISKRGQSHYVTGLSVDDPVMPHAPRAMKRRLRQEIYYIKKFGLANHLQKLSGDPLEQAVVNRLDGTVSYVASLEPRVAAHLRQAWADICANEHVSKSFSPRPYSDLEHLHWFIDESELLRMDGTRVLALACVYVVYPEELAQRIDAALREEASDAYGSYQKDFFHWSDAPTGLRDRMARILSDHAIRCDVEMDRLSPAGYRDTYLKLLSLLAAKMMRQADGATVDVVVEANASKVPSMAIEGVLKELYASLDKKNERRPVEMPVVKILPKGSTSLMGVPDALLGILGNYLQMSEKSSLVVRNFERVRNRFKTIHDGVTGSTYHRNNPLLPWRSLNG